MFYPTLCWKYSPATRQLGDQLQPSRHGVGDNIPAFYAEELSGDPCWINPMLCFVIHAKACLLIRLSHTYSGNEPKKESIGYMPMNRLWSDTIQWIFELPGSMKDQQQEPVRRLVPTRNKKRRFAWSFRSLWSMPALRRWFWIWFWHDLPCKREKKNPWQYRNCTEHGNDATPIYKEAQWHMPMTGVPVWRSDTDHYDGTQNMALIRWNPMERMQRQ